MSLVAGNANLPPRPIGVIAAPTAVSSASKAMTMSADEMRVMNSPLKKRLMNQASAMMGSKVPGSAGELVGDLKGVAGVGVAFEALAQSQKYRHGQLTANQYAADVVGDTVGLTTVTLGGAAAGVLLSKFALPIFAGVPLLGFATMTAGMVAFELWNRTASAPFKQALAKIIPAKVAKPIADGFTHLIANPLHDLIWKPLIGPLYRHTVKPIVALSMKHGLLVGFGALALAPILPGLAGVIALEGGMMAATMALGMFVVDKIKPMSGMQGMQRPESGKMKAMQGMPSASRNRPMPTQAVANFQSRVLVRANAANAPTTIGTPTMKPRATPPVDKPSGAAAGNDMAGMKM